MEKKMIGFLTGLVVGALAYKKVDEFLHKDGTLKPKKKSFKKKK